MDDVKTSFPNNENASEGPGGVTGTTLYLQHNGPGHTLEEQGPRVEHGFGDTEMLDVNMGMSPEEHVMV